LLENLFYDYLIVPRDNSASLLIHTRILIRLSLNCCYGFISNDIHGRYIIHFSSRIFSDSKEFEWYGSPFENPL